MIGGALSKLHICGMRLMQIAHAPLINCKAFGDSEFEIYLDCILKHTIHSL